jgi:hypothetical protein
MDPATKPSVLFVYYTYTQQTLKLVEAMADVLRGRGCDVNLGAIEFIDPRYADRFNEFPMPHPFREVVGMIPAELRRRPGKIRVPDIVTEREYDLVCIGSPTWWLSTNVPIRSFLESETAGRVLEGKRFAAAVACRRYWRHNLKTVRRLGTDRGGNFVDGIHPLPRRPGAVAAVADQLPRVWRVPRAVSRREDPTDQPSALPPGAGEGVRGPAGGRSLSHGCRGTSVAVGRQRPCLGQTLQRPPPGHRHDPRVVPEPTRLDRPRQTLDWPITIPSARPGVALIP